MKTNPSAQVTFLSKWQSTSCAKKSFIHIQGTEMHTEDLCWANLPFTAQSLHVDTY